MNTRIIAIAALSSLSACALTTNEAIDDIYLGMSITDAEAILGEPTTVRDLGIVEGTIPAKNIARECRTYRYVDSEGNVSSRTDRFTWVTYNSGLVAGFSDNGYASSGEAYCHG